MKLVYSKGQFYLCIALYCPYCIQHFNGEGEVGALLGVNLIFVVLKNKQMTVSVFKISNSATLLEL